MTEKILSPIVEQHILDGIIDCTTSWSYHRSGPSPEPATAKEQAEIMREYARAFKDANPGQSAEVVAAGRGWYNIRIDGYRRGKSRRLRDIAAMALRLVERVHGDEFILYSPTRSGRNEYA